MEKENEKGKNAPQNQNNNTPQAKKFMLVCENENRGKHIAGTYFEMALANMIRTIEYVFVRANVCSIVGKLQEDTMAESIEHLAKHDLSATQKSTLSRLIFRHMPFFGPLMADAVDNAIYPLRKELKELEEQRDEINEKLQDKNCVKRQELEEKKQKLKINIKASRKALEQQVVGSSSPQLMLEYLSTMSRMMVTLRNFNSHKNPYSNKEDLEKQKSDSKNLALWLEIIFKGERGILLERKTHSQDDTMFLTQDGVLNYNVNKNKKSTRNNDFYFGPGKKIDKGWELTDFGRYFFGSLFLRKVDADRFAKDVCLYIDSPFRLTVEDKQNLQYKENLRAEKEQLIANENGEDRIVNPRIIGDTESCQNNIIREMLDMHRIRIPREKRIDADITEGILAMDALNELRKCPKIIHDTFCLDEKDNFITKGENPNGEIVVNKLVRPQDRFVDLALRSIDQNKVFTDIRFHLRLGSFRFRFYHKETIDGSVEPVRTVQKEINGFGRWNDVEKLRYEKYQTNFQIRTINNDGLEQPVPDSMDSKPYITDWRTTYNIHANRIGLAWGLPQMTGGYYMPDLNIDNGDNQNRKATIDMLSPMCYLSIYDLPALLFYNHIYNLYHGTKYSKNGIVNAETIIKKKYEALHDFFVAASSSELSVEELLEKQQELKIADEDLPDKLRCFLGTKKLFNKRGKPILKKTDSGKKVIIMKEWRANDEKKRHALNKLLEVIEEDVFRLNTFEKKHSKIIKGGRDNRYGRRGHADVRHGSIARYLAKSMLRWQPAIAKVGGGKITSPNFRVLSDYLANYGIGVKEEFADDTLNNLKCVLREATLIESQNYHPFLKEKVLNSNPKNIEQLYTIYLNAEKEYAEELTEKIRNGIEDVVVPPFARPNGLRWNTSLNEAALRYTEIPTAPFDETASTHNAPIMLPDGLFTPHIIKLLRIALADTSIDEHKTLAPMGKLLESAPNTFGASHIIRYWFDHVAHDGPQSFYNNGSQKYKRFYRALSLLNPQRKPNKQLIPDYFTEDEITERLKYARKKNKVELKDKVIKAYNLDSKKTEKVDEKLKQMREMLNEVAAMEQSIRRYRVQDITLFLTVRDMLLNMLSSKYEERKKENIRKQTLERISKMRLKDFGFGFDFKLFAATDEDSSYTYKHKSGVKIIMPMLSLNNYGSIFRVLSEGQRLDSLLSGLKELGITEVNFSDLTAEMAKHDEKRKEFLKIAQNIEQKAYDQNYSILSNDRLPGFYKKEIIYDADNPERILNPSTDAKVNHFPDLVKLLNEYSSFISIKYKEKNGEERNISLSEFVKELRNAAAHNRYPTTYVFKELRKQTKGQTINVQNIIDMILNMVNQDIEEMNKKQ